MLHGIATAFAAALLGLASNGAASVHAVPVTIGSEPGLDACMSLGAVSSSRLAVRAGPGTNYPRIDSLPRGANVFLCSDSRDGQWFGVVYASGDSTDCGVTSPVDAPKAYVGACRSGWVKAQWVTVVAG